MTGGCHDRSAVPRFAPAARPGWRAVLTMLARLRIGPKLLLAPGAVLLLLALLSCAAYVALARQHASLEAIVGQRAASTRAAGGLATQSQRAHADIYRLLSWIGGSFPVARIEPLRQDILARHARIAAGLEALGRATGAPAERRQVAQALQAHRRYALAVREVMELAPRDGSIGANAMLKADAAFALVAQRLADLAAFEEALSRAAAASARRDFLQVSVLMPAVVAIAVGLSLAITLAVRASLLREIRGIGRAARGLASGDLTVGERAGGYGGDELADTSRQLDAGIRNLSAMLRNVAESARVIGAASRDIRLGGLSLGSRAVYRAGALARTEGAMQDLAATLRLSGEAARSANRLASSAGDAADAGGDLVGRLVAALDAGRRGAERVVELVDALDAAAGASGTLALNAALATAQARPGAPGVAAVAAQVRALARQVALASREIRAVLARSLEEIEGGAAWARQAGSSMERIASSVREVEDIAGHLGARSGEQASHLRDVSQAIVRMDQVTRQNCTLVEEAAAAARTLQLQALALSRTVAGFRLEEEGETPAPAAKAPPKDDRAAPAPATARQRHERRRAQACHLRLASSRK